MHAHSGFSSFLVLIAVILYIITISTNHLYSADLDAVDGVGSTANLGYFQFCFNAGSGGGNSCTDIGFTDCSVNSLPFLNSGGDCSMFKASHVLLIIAIVSSGIGCMFMAAFAARQFFEYHHTIGTTLAQLGFVCAIISWGLAIGSIKNLRSDDSAPQFGYDYGFYLVLAGWICNLIGGLYYYGAGRTYYVKGASGI